jgi:hypothetical protein
MYPDPYNGGKPGLSASLLYLVLIISILINVILACTLILFC